MHIPDNYLSPQTCAVMTAAVAPAWVISVRRIKAELPARKIAMMGVGAAFSFLGMMFNVPMPGGTTGHAVGGTLIALLLGPYAACISVSIALLLQALLFGDGGILSFGANCFNMAFVLPFVGYTVACLIAPSLRGMTQQSAAAGHFNGQTVDTAGMLTGSPAKSSPVHFGRRELAAAGIGAYIGINAAALCAAIEFGIQPMLFRDAAGNALYCPYGLQISIPAMMIGHLTIFGIAEVIFTVSILAFVSAVAPEMFMTAAGWHSQAFPETSVSSSAGASGVRGTSPALKIFLAALIVATPIGLLAEGTAWGEWGADEIAATGAGYTPSGMQNGLDFSALLPDYSFNGIPAWVGYILSAAIGAAILIIAFRLLSLIGRQRDTAEI